MNFSCLIFRLIDFPKFSDLHNFYCVSQKFPGYKLFFHAFLEDFSKHFLDFSEWMFFSAYQTIFIKIFQWTLQKYSSFNSIYSSRTLISQIFHQTEDKKVNLKEEPIRPKKKFRKKQIFHENLLSELFIFHKKWVKINKRWSHLLFSWISFLIIFHDIYCQNIYNPQENMMMFQLYLFNYTIFKNERKKRISISFGDKSCKSKR